MYENMKLSARKFKSANVCKEASEIKVNYKYFYSVHVPANTAAK